MQRRKNFRLTIGTCVLISAINCFPAGCSSTQIKDVSTILHPEEINGKNLTVDDILRTYFTDEAYESLKDIPMVYGYVAPKYSGYAVGVNFWSRLASFFTLNGFGRKVVIREGALHREKGDLGTIIHEYLHHAESLGFIDYNLFRERYKRLENDDNFKIVFYGVRHIPDESNVFYWLFNISMEREIMAKMGESIATGTECPDYMKEVYTRVLRLDNNENDHVASLEK